METSGGAHPAVRSDRKVTPPPKDILFSEDLAAIFRVTTSQARQNLSAGVYGPRFKIGRRYGILRSVLLAHLESLSALPEEKATASPTGSKTIDLITRQRRVHSLKPNQPNPSERRPR